MKDFKNFVNSENKNNQTDNIEKEKINQPEEPKLSDFKEDDVKLINSLTKKYANNKEKLISDIVSLAGKNKKEGKLSNKQLEAFEQKISPMLNKNQKKMLDEIMQMLK